MKKNFVRILAFVLCLSMMIPLFGCANKNINREKLVTCQKQSLEVWFYELLLSRMKAQLAREKQAIKEDGFWESDHGDGRTWEEYCRESTLDAVKNYLAGLVMFKEQKMTLDDKYYDYIDEDIEFYIDYDGEESEDKFNQIISEFGVNINMLKLAYEYEYKLTMLRNSLYGENGEQISSSVKEEYFEKNYYCFKQVLMPTYYYEYLKDDAGNVIYYDKNTGYIAYDEINGHVAYDEKGAAIKDSDGQRIYFDDNGVIVYDTVNGTPGYVSDDKQNPIRYEYTDKEKDEIKAKAGALLASIEKGDTIEFDKQVKLAGNDEYSHGYYLSDGESGSFTDDYQADILAKLKDMAVGDTAIISSDYGYHVIMKYELTDGEFENDEYELMFANFTSGVVNWLFTLKCAGYYDKIDVDSDALASAKSIKEIGVNYYY